MARYRDDGEVQIDNSTNGRFRIAFQWLIVIAVFNVGTLLITLRTPALSDGAYDVTQRLRRKARAGYGLMQDDETIYG